jgi:hypothetical protein
MPLHAGDEPEEVIAPFQLRFSDLSVAQQNHLRNFLAFGSGTVGDQVDLAVGAVSSEG